MAARFIFQNGDVGLGINTPEYKVDIDGSIGTSQVRHSIRPTLNLDFANSKELDSRITFYRDSIATYYDDKGIIRYANVNEPRFDHDPATGESKGLLIEEARTNIALYTNNLKTSEWTTNTPGYGVENFAVAPDGSMSAYRLVEGTSSAGSVIQTRFIKSSPISTFANTTFTFSMYVKSYGVKRNVFLLCQQSADAFYAHFDIVSGTVVQSSGNGAGSLTSALITGVGNGWFRISISGSCGNASSIYPMVHLDTDGGVGFGATAYTGDGSSGVLIWAPQIEVGAFPTSYIPSDTRFTSRSTVATYHDETGILRTAPVNGARYGYKYDGRKWVETGLILEPAATNLILLSRMGNIGTNWQQYNTAVITSNYSTAPDDTLTAGRIVTTSNGTVRVGTTSLVTSTIYAASIWIKSNTSSNYNLYLQVGDTDVVQCTVTPTWQRFSGFGAPQQNGYNFIDLEQIQAGADISVWGAQLETGYITTSYIQTYGSSVTRSADVATSVAYTREADKPILQMGEFFNLTSGSIYADFETFSTQGTDRVIDIEVDGNITMSMMTAANGAYVYTPTLVTSFTNGLSSSGTAKYALSYEDNNFAFSVNGVTQTDTSGTLPDYSTATISIGHSQNYSPRELNGTIKKISFYDQRLSNNEITALTENN